MNTLIDTPVLRTFRFVAEPGRSMVNATCSHRFTFSAETDTASGA